MAICDKDAEYTSRLVNYIAASERDRFEVRGFSEEESYRKAEQERAFDFLLFGEGFLCDKAEGRGKEHTIYLSGETLTEEQGNIPVLFKYQAADNLLRGVYAYIGRIVDMPEPKRVFYEGKQIIAVCSPWQHRLKTPLALAAAEELSSGKKVLYLNFSVCSGFYKSMGLERGMDMGDLFYLLREGEEEFLAKLKSAIYPIGNFSVIPPPVNPEHYMEWRKEEVIRFLELLLERTEYEILLLDMGCMVSGFFEVLDRSARIWILKENHAGQDPGVEEMRELLKRHRAGLQKRAEEVLLPEKETWREDGSIRVEELYMGEVGNCVRRLLGGEHEFKDRTDTQERVGRAGFE